MIRFLRDADEYKRNMERQLPAAVEAAYTASRDAVYIQSTPAASFALMADPTTGRIFGGGFAFATKATRVVDAQIQEFYKLPFRHRVRRIISGQMPGVDAYDVNVGFVPYGTGTSDLNSAISAAASQADPAQRVVRIVQDMTIGTFVLSAGVKIISPNGSKLIMGNGYLQLNDYSELVGVEIVEGQVRSNTTSTVGAKTIGCMFTNSTVSPGASVGAIRLTGNAHYCDVLWNDVNCNQGNAQGIITDLGRSNWIAFNRVRGVPDRDRLISMCGRYNLAEYNWLDGGLTGITGLISRATGAHMRDSTVRNNWIFNVTEEGIGVDSSSNASLIACVDRVTLTGKSGTNGGTPGLTFARSATTGIVAGMFAMVLKCPANPDLEGSGYEIVSSSVNAGVVTIVLPTRGQSDAVFNAIGTAGTIIGIQWQCPDNVFEANYLFNISETPISCFGAGYRCVFRENLLENCSNSFRSNYQFQISAQVTTIAGIASDSATVATGSSCAVVASHIRFYGNRVIAERDPADQTPVRFTTMSYGNDPSSYIGSLTGSEVDGNTPAISIEPIRSTQTPPAFTTSTPGYIVADLGSSSADDTTYAWSARKSKAEMIQTRKSSQRSFTGNGSTTVFTFPHGLGVTPRVFSATPANAVAQPTGTLAVTADSTNVTLTYSAAPAAGTGTISLVVEV